MSTSSVVGVGGQASREGRMPSRMESLSLVDLFALADHFVSEGIVSENPAYELFYLVLCLLGIVNQG